MVLGQRPYRVTRQLQLVERTWRDGRQFNAMACSQSYAESDRRATGFVARTGRPVASRMTSQTADGPASRSSGQAALATSATTDDD